MNYEKYFDNNKEYTCISCYDNITNENYVLYKDNEISPWKSCNFCEICIINMIETQWELYVQNVATEDCEPTLRKLLNKGPPINLRENSIICDNEQSEVYKFWFANSEQSAKLKGSLEGEQRNKWIQDKFSFYNF